MQALFDIDKLKKEFSKDLNLSTQKLNNFFDGAINQLKPDEIDEIRRINKVHFEFIEFTINSIEERTKLAESL